MFLKYYNYVKESKLTASWDNAYLSYNISTLTNPSVEARSPTTHLFFEFHHREIPAFYVSGWKNSHSTYHFHTPASHRKVVSTIWPWFLPSSRQGLFLKAIPILLDFLQLNRKIILTLLFSSKRQTTTYLWNSESFPLSWQYVFFFQMTSVLMVLKPVLTRENRAWAYIHFLNKAINNPDKEEYLELLLIKMFHIVKKCKMR